MENIQIEKQFTIIYTYIETNYYEIFYDTLFPFYELFSVFFASANHNDFFVAFCLGKYEKRKFLFSIQISLLLYL